mgnify:CR=1 FL=1
MPNYQNSKIYRIISNNTNRQYIGSTVQPLSVRLAGHKKDYKRYQNGKTHYVTSFDIFEDGNYRIELICNYPCNSKAELHSKEGEYIRDLECVNRCIAGRTKKEYDVKYREQNKAYRFEKIECKCGSSVSRNQISRHRRTNKHQRYINKDKLLIQ